MSAPDLTDGLFDAQGRWVPRRLIREVDLARHELVLELVKRATVVSGELATFRRKVMADVLAFADLSAEQYGARIGGTKGNITLTSHDGKYRVVYAIADRLAFDERLQAAKELIDACIVRWTVGSSDEVRALVEHAFQCDKAGKVSTERVLGLRRLYITDGEWIRAMSAIADSVQVSRSKAYVRFYERVGDEPSNTYRSINLDISTAGET